MVLTTRITLVLRVIDTGMMIVANFGKRNIFFGGGEYPIRKTNGYKMVIDFTTEANPHGGGS